MMTTASSSSITPRKIRVIGVPLDLGQSRRGVDMGPSAVRVAGLEARLEALGHEVEDAGNVAVAIPEQKKEGDTHAKYLKEITATCTKHAELVVKTLEAGKVPLALGGDHSMAAGTVSGVAEFYRRQSQSVGLIWIDAHGDINTPLTSPSGNVHGMPVSIALEEHHIDPERSVLVGLRDIDAGERERIKALGVRAFSMSEIDRVGMERVMEEAIAIAGPQARSAHVSFDMDGIDPSEAPGVGTPVRGGITYREAHLAMEMISEAGILGSLEVTEINPILDEHNRTAELAVELILSALGKTIL